MLSDMRRELLALEPNLLFLDNQTMEAQVAATLFPARAGARIVGFVGFIAAALAAIGLYGAISYSVQRRTREIGVRMALGATRSAVMALFMRRGLSVAGIGLLAGSALAAGAMRAVRSLLYGVSVIDPAAWGSAASLVLAAVILANLIPAHRASRVDPSAAIRTE